MPIDNEHQAIFEVPGNPNLQRYMSLEKFVFLINRKSLFFTRLDKFDDPFEGTNPIVVKSQYVSQLQHLNATGYFNSPMSDHQMESKFNEYEDLTEKFRALNTVNCWHISDFENALMWRAYTNANSGIMIKSDYGRIVKSFAQTKESIQSSLVKYRNYQEDTTIPFGNTTLLAVHKTQFYSGEKEFRLIHKVNDNMWIHNWDEEEVPVGVNICVDIDELIEEIRIAPFAPVWYLDVVKSICDKFQLDKKVLRSSLEK